jgi:hypothetical protein
VLLAPADLRHPSAGVVTEAPRPLVAGVAGAVTLHLDLSRRIESLLLDDADWLVGHGNILDPSTCGGRPRASFTTVPGMANVEIEPLTLHLRGVGSADAGKIVTAALDLRLEVSAVPGNVTLRFSSGSPDVLIAALKFLRDMVNATIGGAVLYAFGAAEVPPGASTTD